MDHEALAASRVGTTLCNKWTLEKVLGVGGMAAVYVAVHKIGRREAIKILHRDIAAQADLRARFEQEAQAVNRFAHPGVVEVRDIDVAEDGSPFLVMELLEGESLGERARRLGGLPLDEVLRLSDELLDALAAAHARGIVHRDIKLDNLFVETDGHLKVLDFGIARVRDGLPPTMRTRVGATLGTVPYMPPEQIKGLEVDGRADLFAVGATMFRLIARRRIHEAPNEASMLAKMATEAAPPISSVAIGVPPGVALIVDRALEFDRDRRYPDAVTMQADVRAVRAGQDPPYATAHARDPRTPAVFTDAPTMGAPAQVVSSEPRTAAASPGAKLGAALASQSPVGTEMSLPGQPSAAIPISVALPSGQLFSPAGRDGQAIVSTAPAASIPAISVPISMPMSSAPMEPEPTTPGRRSGPTPLIGGEPTLRSPQPIDASAPTTKPSRELPVPASAPVPVSVTAPLPMAIAAPAPADRPSKNSLLLIAIGAAFLLLGVAITLALALHARSESSADADAGAPAEVDPNDPSIDDGLGKGGSPKKPAIAPPHPLGPTPAALPAAPGGPGAPGPPASPPPGPPGKSKGKGHK
jgi:eukaryotic-like serine/threonine-protein kinase